MATIMLELEWPPYFWILAATKDNSGISWSLSLSALSELCGLARPGDGKCERSCSHPRKGLYVYVCVCVCVAVCVLLYPEALKLERGKV
jgi:hypothetical protein